MNWGYMLLPGMGGNNTLLMGNEGVIALLGERGGACHVEGNGVNLWVREAGDTLLAGIEG